MAEENAPGRFCPADYGLGEQAFACAPRVEADVLYVVGGLYGNTVALDLLLAMFDAEAAASKRIVFNGDFHWFDVARGEFSRVEKLTRPHLRLRGNVETELARDGEGAGCGCAYPAEVDDGTVERSNRILVALKRTARAAGHAAGLASLPMVATARVGDCRIAITHGDERSLAGWRLGRGAIEDSWDDGLATTLRTLGADVIASSHTCEPVACSRRFGESTFAAINNGAAGMANFAGSTAGLFTRIASDRAPLPAAARRLYGARVAGADVGAIAIDFDARRWLERFDRQWPAGSEAAVSYRERLARGTGLAPAQACSGVFTGHGEQLAA